ncbi:MAG: TonB-dependent receptor domain-containing protein, partial [Saprospiraceae bacterium]
RNPDNQPQYIALDLGAITLLGSTKDNLDNFQTTRLSGFSTVTITGNEVFTDSYTQSSVENFGATGDMSVLVKAAPKYVAPEKITSYEIGYKGLPMNKFFVDFNVYYSQYKDFLGNRNVITPHVGSTDDVTGIGDIASGNYSVFYLYQNAEVDVISYGAGLNVEYSLPRKFKLGANYTFSDLDWDEASDPDFRPGFNTAKHRMKFMLGNSDIWKGIGFNVSYRYNTAFDYTSSFADGEVPAAGVIDLQLSGKIPAIKSTVKLGVANLLNDEYNTAPGAAFVGRQMYIGFTYDDLFR